MSWIQTFSGKKAMLLDMRVEMVCIEDIARSLSMQCRFNGHVNTFYSVAQHSMEVASHLPRQLALAGLLHDSAEAYLGDIVAPLKGLVAINTTKAAAREDDILSVIFAAFNIPFPGMAQWLVIEEVDRRMLMTEKRDLLGPEPEAWCVTAEPYEGRLDGKQPWQAETEFRALFNQLTEPGRP